MSDPNFIPTAPAAALNGLKSAVPFSSRLRTGRALAVDVWSIFKSVGFQSRFHSSAYFDRSAL